MDRQSSEFNDSNRSLRRSFVAIHGKSSPIDDNSKRCYGRKDSSSSLPKSSGNRSSSLHQHKKSRGSNSKGNRRTSMDTTSPSPLCPPPQPIHSRKPQQQTPHRRSTYTGMTADEAQKRVAELLNDKLTIQQKQQQQQQQEEPTRRPRVVSSSSNHNLNKHEHSLHTSMPNIHHQQQQPKQLGYRPDYKLGQTVRSTSHIKIPTSSQNAMQQVSTLMKFDFAFIKRSNGLYSYAILAYRTNNDNKGESLTFVMDDKGCTKMIRKKYWCEYIRLVNTDDLELEQQQHDHDRMRLSKEGLLYPPPSYKRRVTDPHQDTTTDDMHQFSRYKKEDIDMLCQEIPIVCREVPQDDAVDEYYTQGEEEDDETALPDMIAFKPTNGNEECSLISSVSDRARRAYSAARIWRSGGD